MLCWKCCQHLAKITDTQDVSKNVTNTKMSRHVSANHCISSTKRAAYVHSCTWVERHHIIHCSTFLSSRRTSKNDNQCNNSSGVFYFIVIHQFVHGEWYVVARGKHHLHPWLCYVCFSLFFLLQILWWNLFYSAVFAAFVRLCVVLILVEKRIRKEWHKTVMISKTMPCYKPTKKPLKNFVLLFLLQCSSNH